MKAPTVNVTTRALVARINRKLAHDGEALKASRSDAERQSFGNYYTVDTNTGNPQAWWIDDLEKWVHKEMPGVLKPHERVQD